MFHKGREGEEEEEGGESQARVLIALERRGHRRVKLGRKPSQRHADASGRILTK